MKTRNQNGWWVSGIGFEDFLNKQVLIKMHFADVNIEAKHFKILLYYVDLYVYQELIVTQAPRTSSGSEMSLLCSRWFITQGSERA